MLRIIFIFALLLLSVWLGIYLSHEPGYVLLAVHQWTIEMTLGVAIIGLIAAFCALYFLIALLRLILHIPHSWQNWLIKRRKKKAQKKTRQGLIAFSEGYWEKAQNHLIQALPNTETPLINYLIAARAAQELGNLTLRDEFIRKAQQSMPEAKVAVELTQAQLQLANNQWEQALSTLTHLRDLAPSHPYVLKLLMTLYKQVRDWPHLIELLPELKRNQVLNHEEQLRTQQFAYLEAMQDYIRHGHHQALEEIFASRPRALAYNPEIIAVFSQYLIKQERFSESEVLLRKTLNKYYNEKLIELYGLILDNSAKLSYAESLLKTHPNSPALLLSLGRISERQNLWGKARSYYEKSIQHKPCAAAYFELGQLLQKLNEQEKATQAFRKGLELSVFA